MESGTNKHHRGRRKRPRANERSMAAWSQAPTSTTEGGASAPTQHPRNPRPYAGRGSFLVVKVFVSLSSEVTSWATLFSNSVRISWKSSGLFLGVTEP